MKLFIILAALIVATFGEPQYGDDSGTNYMFKYMVKHEPIGPNFGHGEARFGNRVVGTYYVYLPDGRIQKVDYVADENGYRPTVTYLTPN